MKCFSPPHLGRMATFGHLPTLPHILLTLIEVCNKEPVSIQEVSKIIGKDPALSARLMGMVHLLHEPGPIRITSVDQAVSLVGVNALKKMVANSGIIQAVGNSGQTYAPVWLKSFWHHALKCAFLTKLIAARGGYHSPDEAYLSALIHDVGKLILWAFHSKQAGSHGEQTGDHQPDVAFLEQTLGVTHGEVGGQMVHQWNLRSFMADAVFYHHEPVDRILNALPLVKFVFAANALCSDNLKNAEAPYQVAEQVICLSRNDAERLESIAIRQVRQAADFFEIELEPSEGSGGSVGERDIRKQRELLRTVRDTSLVRGTLQNSMELHDEASTLGTITQGLQLLFGVRDILLFLYNHERGVLVGNSSLKSGRDALLQDIVIPLKNGKSLIAECLLQEKPLDSSGYLKKGNLSILDHEVVRFMGKDGMFCLPLIARDTPVGALVLAIDNAEAYLFFEEIKLLTAFSNRAALLIYAEKVRQVQEKSAEPEPLAAPSDLARKVVHEVSNPLGIIKNYLRVLGPKLAENGSGQEEIRIINEEIDRVSSIVRKLSDFSGPNVQKKESVDVNDLISDLIKITHEPLLLQSNIKAHFSRESFLPPIISDKNGLKQVFINLIKNAVEAMPEGGNLFIQTRSVSDAGGNEGHASSDRVPAHIEISVRDEGFGIPQGIKARLFEPFVSSKGAGHAGLGLSIAHTIVRELDGKITCESNGEKGTLFRVLLPTGKQETA